jgi:selenide,water dikinase
MSFDLFSLPGECGCAAKMPVDHLKHLLKNLDLPASAALIVGPDTLDDAGVYRISDELCLVLTVDFFPPVARDPFVYGQIAAANALSDVYAMGGKPIVALAVVCFPASLDPAILGEISRGAAAKLLEAGAVLAGGHSITDPLPKFGLSVIGTAHATKILTNASARPGDALILTKPLGTGITIMAAKARLATQAQEAEANRVMGTLNAAAGELALKHGAHSCTDVTGFGLLGHARQMADASGVSMEFFIDRIPRLDGVIEYAGMGMLSAAAYANRKHNGSVVAFAGEVALAEQDLLFDPQTSGGLLIACPQERTDAFVQEAITQLTTQCGIIGQVTKKEGDSIVSVTVKGKT